MGPDLTTQFFLGYSCAELAKAQTAILEAKKKIAVADIDRLWKMVAIGDVVDTGLRTFRIVRIMKGAVYGRPVSPNRVWPNREHRMKKENIYKVKRDGKIIGRRLHRMSSSEGH